MPLFVDEEGRAYYSLHRLNPVTGRQWGPIHIHFNRQPGDPPSARQPLLHMPPEVLRRLPLWCVLVSCFNIIMLALCFLCWWSGWSYVYMLGFVPLMGTFLFQFFVLGSAGKRVPFDRPVRYWGGQPVEPLVMEMTGRLGGMAIILPPLLSLKGPLPVVFLGIAGLVLLFPAWMVMRRLFAPRDGSILYP